MRKIFVWLLAVTGPILAAPAFATDYYNLTSLDNNGNATGVDTIQINGVTTPPNTAAYGIFTSNTNSQVVGTGVLDPFVRIQQNGNGNCKDPCIESGYNTDGTAQFETKDKGGTNWDHSLKLSDVGTETIGGVVYRDFVLDINEANNDTDRYLSLDKFQLYLAGSGNLSNFTESPPDCAPSCGAGPYGLQNATKIFDIDANGDSTIALNYNLNNGSGKGIDLIARIPDALFQNSTYGANPYVYLYSSFGATGNVNCTTLVGVPPGQQAKCWDGNGPPPSTTPVGVLPVGNYGQSAGFEEWATRKNKNVAEPASAALMLAALAGLVTVSRRRRATP